jgi:hypothetical protein
VDRDRERTEHFSAGWPGRGGSDQHPGVGVGDQLDEPVVARAVDPAPGRGPDRRDRSPHADFRAACLGFGEADGADFGIGEGDAGQRPVAGRLVGLAEDVAGCDARLIYRDVRERPRTGDVADGPHAVADTQVIVHGNERLSVVDARGGHAQSPQVSAPPGSHQQALAAHGTGALQVHREIAAVVADPPQPCSGQDPDAFPAEHLADQLAGFRLLGRQQPVRGLDNSDRGPESGERLGQFHADRAAADDGERGRGLLGLQSLTIGPVGGTGQPVDRGNRWLGPGGEHQSARRAELLSANDDGTAAGHGGATPDEPAALAGEPLNGDRVVPVIGGLLPDPPGHDRPVRLNRGISCQLADPSRLGEGVRRPDDHLARHASPVRAFPADQGRLDAHHPQARFGEASGDELPAHTKPDHDHVRLDSHYRPFQCAR